MVDTWATLDVAKIAIRKSFTFVLNWFTQTVLILFSIKLQSILDISKSKGLSEILWDIHTSKYQICKNEEKTNQTLHISQMNM